MASFQTETRDEWLIVKCSMNLDAKATSEYLQSLKEWAESPHKGIVLDLSRVFTVERDFFKAVVQTKTALKGAGKSFYSIGINDSLLKKLRAEGMESAFQPKPNFEEVKSSGQSKQTGGLSSGSAPGQAAGKVGQLNMDFIAPFLAATKKTFETQIQTSVKPSTPFLKSAAIPGVDIAGVLTLVSDGATGSFVLCFSQDVFLKVYGRMVGDSFDKITPEIEDAASEIVNIIYGIAKIELNMKGYSFPKAFPTVLTGEKISIRQAGSGSTVIMPFDTDIGKFHIEIEFNAV